MKLINDLRVAEPLAPEVMPESVVAFINGDVGEGGIGPMDRFLSETARELRADGHPDFLLPVWRGGVYVKRRLLLAGLGDEDAEGACFHFGRLCFGRPDPWAVAERVVAAEGSR